MITILGLPPTRKLALVSLLVLSGLLAVTLWDSIEIIRAYRNENILTIVRTVEIEDGDTLPYLEDLILTLTFDASLVFPELENANELFDELMYAGVLQEEILNGTFSLSTANMSKVEDRIRMLAIFRQIDLMDSEGVLCAGGSVHECAEGITSGLILSGTWLTDLMRNQTLLESLETQLWARMKPYIVPEEHPEFDDWFLIDTPTNFEMTAQVITKDILKGKMRATDILIGDLDGRNATSTTIMLGIATKSMNFGEFNLSSPSNEYCDIEVKIDNIGVYDKKATTECTDLDIILDKDDYYNRTFLEALIDQCGCVPYEYKRQYRQLSGLKATKMPPFCDAEAYIGCSKKQLKLADGSQPCVRTKNQYHFTKVGKCGCGSIILDIGSANFYAVYEERYQLSVSQFVSQLGGDIGLYTGLSILSIWQFVLYLHKKYSESKVKHCAEGNVGASSSVRSKLQKAFFVSVIKNIEESVAAATNNKKGDQACCANGNTEEPIMQMIRQIELRVEDICERYSAVIVEMKRLELRMDDILELVNEDRR